MKGLQEARASYRNLSLQEALYELVQHRRLLLNQMQVTLTDYQLKTSTHIMKAVVAGGDQEIPLLWARRTGKTEMLVDTGVTIGTYWIHRLCQNFTIGLINPARGEQGVMVIRERLRQRVESISPWLELTLGVTSILGDGRKTPDYVLHDSSGFECQIRAISADPSAHSKGAGFQLSLLEQCEEMDETVMKEIIFPMAAGEELQSTRVLAGNPSLEVLNGYYREATRSLKYPFLVDEKTASHHRPSYRGFVEMQKQRLGEDSDEFRTQYGCEWIQLRNKLIEREQLLLLEKAHTPDATNTRFAGTDMAKLVDRTVCTVLERSGAELIVIDWLELEGADYEEQWDLIASFLRPYKVTINLVDSTGTQDSSVDGLRSRCRDFCRTEGFKFTAESADNLYKIYEREIRQGRLRYRKQSPGEPEVRTRSRSRFLEEHQDVERVFRANKLKLAAPDRRGAHDDYVASGALAVYAAAGYRASSPDAVYAG